MNKPVFTGVGAAVVTFFDEHGHVDNAATASHARHLVDRGVRAIVVAGSTGEASHLSMKERLVLFDAVQAEIGDEVPIVLGTGMLAAGVSVAGLTKRAAQHGAAAALVLSPHHGDIAQFYAEVVASAGTMPVVAYHHPGVSPHGIPIEVLKTLKVSGLKDSSGSPERLLEELAHFHKPIYIGNAAMLAYAGMLGAAGAILAVANLEPELCADAFAGNVTAQRDLLCYHKLYAHQGVKGLKEELARRFHTSTAQR